MDNSQPTEGADLSTVDGVAEALMSRMEEPEAAPEAETPEPEEVTEEENPEAVDDTEEVEAEGDSVEESKDTESEESDVQDPESEEEAPQFSSIQELAEALEISPEDFLANFKGKIKVNGEEDEVSLAEALNGYQRQADYQRKTAEVAEQRREFEAAVEQTQAELAQRNQIAQASLQAAENVLMQEFAGIDWQQLEQDDAGTAALYKQKFAQRQNEIQGYQQALMAQQQQEQMLAAQQYEQAQKAFIAQEREALTKAAPDWNEDTDKQVATYLKDYGFRPEEIGQLVDHRQALLVQKAMLYDQQQKSVEVAKAKVKPLPKMLKPNSKQNQRKPTEKLDKLRGKLKRSGSVNDAAAMLLERMG